MVLSHVLERFSDSAVNHLEPLHVLLDLKVVVARLAVEPPEGRAKPHEEDQHRSDRKRNQCCNPRFQVPLFARCHTISRRL